MRPPAAAAAAAAAAAPRRAPAGAQTQPQQTQTQRPRTAGGSSQSAVPAAERDTTDARSRLAARAQAAGAGTQICISARRPSGEPSSALPSPHSPQSPQRAAPGGQAVAAAPSPPAPVALSRAATTPAPAAPATIGLAKNPLDVLASLVQQNPPLPQINTRGDGPGAAAARKQQQQQQQQSPSPLPPAARSLKSAKLDSLLDDLLGEMQALSAEVRPESDRESIGSTASAASPVDPHVAAVRDPAARSRLDSSVSSTSSSSTLSAGGILKKQPCATCGAGTVGAVVRSSGLRNGEIPPGTQAVEHQGRIYCVRDYRRAAQVCRGCRQPCESTAPRDALHALDAWWHRKCFNCQECHHPFPDKSFYVLDQRPYCRYDYHKLNNSLCAACRDPIEGPCAQVHEGRFHPACFACAHCNEPLRDVYYALDGLFFCERHVGLQQHQRLADKRKTAFGSVH
ncbi:hypothetical protein IWQ56_004389 [Coemansia nantahalensis]|nr:hypothetical protein IWQ56_004389 [Coemansia nantahalensis]